MVERIVDALQFFVDAVAVCGGEEGGVAAYGRELDVETHLEWRCGWSKWGDLGC